MRIRRSHSTGWRGFWSDTRKRLRSRWGLAQFMLALGLGLTLAAMVGALYKLGGWKLVDPLFTSLRVETQETVEEIKLAVELPTLYFDIGFEEFQAMAQQRDEAVAKGILLLDDDDWMRAEIRFQGETIRVRLRLKGDWTDHLGENKWSWRVKTRGDAALLGMRSFSVQSPATRRYLTEWLYLEDLRRSDILAPRYSFVNVVVNGEGWGIYALEESFSKELLESLGRRESVIVRFDEGLLWEHRALLYDDKPDLGKLGIDPVANTYSLFEFAPVDEFSTTSVRQDPVLSAHSATALGLLRGFQTHELSTAQVFDTDLLGRYLAHANLWAARHEVIWHNERYYYNPLTSRLEPVGYDAMPLDTVYERFFDLSRYDDLSVMESYAKEVLRICQPQYLEEFRATYEADFERYREVLLQGFPKGVLAPPWDKLAERQHLLRTSLHPPQTMYAYQMDYDSAALEMQVGNIVRYPVVLQQVKVGEQTADVQFDWVVESSRKLLEEDARPAVVFRTAPGAGPLFAELQIPAAVIKELLPQATTLYSNTLQLVTNLYGVDGSIIVDVQQRYPPVLSERLTPAQPSVEELLAQHPFLTTTEELGFVALKPGTWEVDGDLVLPDGWGMVATQAVTLTFDPEALLFANGPLLLDGPEEIGIHLGPKEDAWAGLIVLQAGPEAVSILNNVEIRGTSGISREGWMTTGGVTFYESPVILKGCRLFDSLAEDAINVLRADFEFWDTEFGNIASDAFDGDFVKGRIEDCAFHDVLGDAIDVSGGEVRLQGVALLRVHDKGISAGEASKVTATNIKAHDVAIAIASKDLAWVTVDEIHISRAWIAGLAAYRKKMEYGPGIILATKVEFGDSSPQVLSQTGSYVAIDGKQVRTQDLDVDEFYARLETLSAMRLLDYRLGSTIRLVGYALASAEARPGAKIDLYLYWQADSRPDKDYTVFVHILDAMGGIAAQRDTMPSDGESATSRWKAGEFLQDHHRIALPADMPAGEYHVVVGLYDWRTGDRLPAYTFSGKELRDGIIPLDPPLMVRE